MTAPSAAELTAAWMVRIQPPVPAGFTQTVDGSAALAGLAINTAPATRAPTPNRRALPRVCRTRAENTRYLLASRLGFAGAGFSNVDARLPTRRWPGVNATQSP